MAAYAVRRIGSGLLLTFVTFAVYELIPVNPACLRIDCGPGNHSTPADFANADHQLGVDRPLPFQYARWVWRFIRHGSFGTALLREVLHLELELVILGPEAPDGLQAFPHGGGGGRHRPLEGLVERSLRLLVVRPSLLVVRIQQDVPGRLAALQSGGVQRVQVDEELDVRIRELDEDLLRAARLQVRDGSERCESEQHRRDEHTKLGPDLPVLEHRQSSPTCAPP